MSNEFYEASGTPATRSQGASSPIRAEFSDIELGFNKMPVLTGNANKPVVVNAGATGLTTVAQLPPAQGGTGAGVLTQGQVVFAGALGVYSGSNFLFWDAANMSLGVGGNTLIAGTTIRAQRPMERAGANYGVVVDGATSVAATTSMQAFYTNMSSTAAATGLTTIFHFIANQGTVASIPAVTNQYGFYATASLAAATNNYGFGSAIPAKATNWNIYAFGAAQNAFAGPTRFGSVVAPTKTVDVTGDVLISGTGTSLQVQGVGQTTASFAPAGNQGATAYLLDTGSAVGTGGALMFGDSFGPFGVIKGYALSGSGPIGDIVVSLRKLAGDSTFTEVARFRGDGTVTFAAAPVLPAAYAVNNVLFMGASGVIAQDGNFQYDSANNRLGIGTAALPTLVSLQVQGGTAGMLDLVLITSSGTPILGSGARLYLSSAQTPARAVYIEGVNTNAASNAHDMVLGTNAGSAAPVERMRITNAGDIYFKDNTVFGFSAANETISVGGVGVANTAIRIIKPLFSTSGAGYGILIDGIIQTGATSAFAGYATNIAVAASAPTAQLRHFQAQSPATFASAVTTQIGFFVDVSLTGAGTNVGFYSNIAAAGNRWNFYAPNTANNLFKGNTMFGDVVVPTGIVHIIEPAGAAPAGSTSGSTFQAITTYSGDPGGTTTYVPISTGTTITGAATVALHRGASFVTTNTHTGIITTSTSAYFHNSINSSGDVTVASCINALLVANSASTAAAVVTQGYILDLDGPALSGAGIYTNITAINIQNQSAGSARTPGFQMGIDIANFSAFAGSTQYGIRNMMAASGVSTARWGYLGQGNANNAFVGNTAFGSVTVPTATVEVTGTIQASGIILSGADLYAGISGSIGWTSRTLMYSPGSGLMHIMTNAGTAGIRLDVTTDTILQIQSTVGGTAGLLVNGAASTVTAGEIRAIAGFWARQTSPLAAGATVQYLIKGSSLTNIGLWFGTGAPGAANTAQAGSLYLRTDGAANTRLYINTSAGAGTTWSAVTTP